jgi:enolase-phosphatase E1
VPGPSLYPAAGGCKIVGVHLPDEASIRIILLDIEGTTTPIDFVTKVLFPYASRKMESFIRDNFQREQVRALIEELRAQQQEDAKRGLRPPDWKEEGREAEIQSAAAYCRWLIEKDSKCTALKSLQGMIWQAGYANGELRGQVYPDVPQAFERWRRQKREIAIYSSGSVLAQRLIFQTTPFGDLAGFIRDYFDTHIGVKQDSASYTKIADALGRSPSEILFLSDAVKEVEAAKAAGMRSFLCDRSERSVATAGDKEVIHSFDELFPT